MGETTVEGMDILLEQAGQTREKSMLPVIVSSPEEQEIIALLHRATYPPSIEEVRHNLISSFKGAVVDLASPASDYVTGQTIFVDGRLDSLVGMSRDSLRGRAQYHVPQSVL